MKTLPTSELPVLSTTLAANEKRHFCKSQEVRRQATRMKDLYILKKKRKKHKHGFFFPRANEEPKVMEKKRTGIGFRRG